jgi:hypothetical protein
MFKPYEGGSEIQVYGVTIYLPPVPKPEYIRGYYLPKSEQKWFRDEIPTFKAKDIDIFSNEDFLPEEEVSWDEARRQEVIKRSGYDPLDLDGRGNPRKVHTVEPDPSYVSEPLDEFRKEQLDRCSIYRYNTDGTEAYPGMWFMNNGTPMYLTPFNYFYLTWWKLNSGYPEFRYTDMLKFYYWQHCFEDPDCTGYIEVAKRSDGKSYKAMAVCYLRTIYGKNIHSGMQSKGDDDAEELFQKKMVEPYKDLPEFLIPQHNHSTNPKKKLLFHAVSKMGKNANLYRSEQNEAIRSTIDYQDSKAHAYDGATINGILVLDEEGKVTTCDVNERHSIVADCVYRFGKVFGKIYSVTTVEEMDKGGASYKKVWDKSDPMKLDQNGCTVSKLKRIFLPAYMTEFHDEYGMPDIEKGKRNQGNRRKILESNPADLLKYKLKYPWTEAELFSANNAECQFNLIKLNEAEERIRTHIEADVSPVKHGYFKWVNNTPFTNVEFVETGNEDDKWHVGLFLDDKISIKPNNVQRLRSSKGTYYAPLNNHYFSSGFDPTKSSKTVSKTRSHAGGSIFFKQTLLDHPLADTFVADYVFQPDDPTNSYMDYLMGLWYYGCMGLIESNITNVFDSFKNWKVYDMNLPNSHFVMWRPRWTFTTKGWTQYKPGLDASETTNDLLVQKTKTLIERSADRLILPRTVKDFIEYDPAQRSKYDLAVASMNAYLASLTPTKGPKENKIDLGKAFQQYNHNEYLG